MKDWSYFCYLCNVRHDNPRHCPISKEKHRKAILGRKQEPWLCRYCSILHTSAMQCPRAIAKMSATKVQNWADGKYEKVVKTVWSKTPELSSQKLSESGKRRHKENPFSDEVKQSIRETVLEHYKNDDNY